jgi:hypothetical protein
MTAQTYANHAHRPWLTAAAAFFWLLVCIGYALCWLGYDAVGQPLLVVSLLLCLLCLILIGRVYTTALQDRIIVLEERLRAERLLTPTQLALWDHLHVKQVIALRFASDPEFAALLDRAARESLTPKAIKQAIRTWRPDTRRT